MIKVVTVSYSLPDNSARPAQTGQTLRQALSALRKAGRENFGNIGTMTARLSDTTDLDVMLQSSDDGNSRLMNSQQIIRVGFDADAGREQIIRRYEW